MSTSTLSMQFASNTAAEFQNWAGALAGSLASAGFVKTSDTGQITPSSFTAVTGSVNTPFGFEIYKFNDSLQSTAPFFVKIEYGSGAYSYCPCLWLTFCTATDGAGTPQGNVSKRFQLANRQTGYTTATQNSYVSYATNGSRFQAALFDGPTFSDPLIISFERTKDTSGNDNSDGLIIFLGGSYAAGNTTGGGTLGNVYAGVVPSSTSVPVVQVQPYVSVPCNYAQRSTNYNGIVNASAPVPYNGCAYNVGLGMLVFQGSDYGPGGTYSETLYGGTHTYRVPLANLIPWTPGQNVTNASSFVNGPTSASPYSGTNTDFDLQTAVMLRYE